MQLPQLPQLSSNYRLSGVVSPEILERFANLSPQTPLYLGTLKFFCAFFVIPGEEFQNRQFLVVNELEEVSNCIFVDAKSIHF